MEDDMDISDDSSFYGNDDQKAHLEGLSAKSDLSDWWSQHQNSIPFLAPAAASASSPSATDATANLYNPYAGSLEARQLSESVPEFLSRLPPRTTIASKYGQWIRIANPHSSTRPTKADLAGLAEEGERLLADWKLTKGQIEERLKDRPNSVVKTAATKERKPVEEALLRIAKERRCTTGKWMLFPSVGSVNHIWGLIAHATATNDLGIAAKVATDQATSDRVPRLICIYTADFADLKDVTTVLRKLVDLGVADKTMGIYYKCDAYTHLGIDSKNEWGFKASLYASKDLLAKR